MSCATTTGGLFHAGHGKVYRSRVEAADQPKTVLYEAFHVCTVSPHEPDRDLAASQIAEALNLYFHGNTTGERT